MSTKVEWKLKTLIENARVCFKNDVNQAKVIMGLTGEGNIMIQIFNVDGEPMEEKTIRLNVPKADVKIESKKIETAADKENKKRLAESRNRTPSVSPGDWKR